MSRTSNFSRNHPYAKARGWVGDNNAGSTLASVSDGTNEVDNAHTLLFPGGQVRETEDGFAEVTFGGLSQSSNSSGQTAAVPIWMRNNASVDLIPGDAVVVDSAADSSVTTTATASNTAIAGIVQAPIARLEYGPVLFNGLSTVINTTGSIARGNYALTSATARLAGATAARVAGSFGVYLTGTDFPDFASASANTEMDVAGSELEIDMPDNIPAGRVLFLALWLPSGASAVDVDDWTRIGAESGFYYFYRTSEGDDTATATWTGVTTAVATVLLLHPNVAIGDILESHDYDATTAAAAVAGLSDSPRYAIAGVQADVASPGSSFIRLGGGSVGGAGSVALVQSSTTSSASILQFADVIPAGQLILVYAWVRSNGTTPPTAPGGWTTAFTHLPYEGNKSPGVLFSKISTGSAEDGGVDGRVYTFSGANQLMGAVFSGVASATPSDDDLGTAASHGGGSYSVTRTVVPASGGLAVMVSHLRNFGANTMSAGGSSALLVQDPDNNWPTTMVYRLGGGSLANQVDVTSTPAHWEQSSAVAFDPATGGVSGTLAGKYIAHASSATSPFSGASQQNDGVFAINLLVDAKPSVLMYGPDLGAGAGEPTADAHIADTSDAHDASAVSLLDSAGLFTATDVEAAIEELAAKDIGYQAHGGMGATETFSALTGWHSGTFDADCTFTFSGATSGIVASMVLELLEDGTGGWDPTWPGSVVWPGGTPVHDTTAGTTTLYLFQSRDGGTTWFGFQAGAGGSASPLTTKGDLWGFDTTDARVPVGTNGYLLVADSTDAQGVVWENPETTGHYEVLMTGASPAEPLEDGSGTDWLYVFVT